MTRNCPIISITIADHVFAGTRCFLPYFSTRIVLKPKTHGTMCLFAHYDEHWSRAENGPKTRCYSSKYNLASRVCSKLNGHWVRTKNGHHQRPKIKLFVWMKIVVLHIEQYLGVHESNFFLTKFFRLWDTGRRTSNCGRTECGGTESEILIYFCTQKR